MTQRGLKRHPGSFEIWITSTKLYSPSPPLRSNPFIFHCTQTSCTFTEYLRIHIHFTTRNEVILHLLPRLVPNELDDALLPPPNFNAPDLDLLRASACLDTKGLRLARQSYDEVSGTLGVMGEERVRMAKEGGGLWKQGIEEDTIRRMGPEVHPSSLRPQEVR